MPHDVMYLNPPPFLSEIQGSGLSTRLNSSARDVKRSELNVVQVPNPDRTRHWRDYKKCKLSLR